MSSHFLWSESIPSHGINTRVWWSHQPSSEAVVFVHGFGGQALKTWSRFPSLLCSEPACAGFDLFFFGYDGLHTEAVSSAGQLMRFLSGLFNSPEDMYRDSGAPLAARVRHPGSYDRVVIVAHSLGAVVSRRAVLDAFNDAAATAWAKRVHLVLFAPAHLGAKLMSLVRQTPIGSVLAILSLTQLLGRYVVLDDLKEGSVTLENLKDDLKRTFDTGTSANLRSRLVTWAENDRVVRNGTLFPDPAPTLVPGHDHLSICKPNDSDLTALKLLIAAL